jgi:hypothetical protein
VAADANAVLGVQAGFALAAAALVFEQVHFAASVGPAEEAVWDELLEAGIGFHFAAGPVFDVVAFDEARPIAIRFA